MWGHAHEYQTHSKPGQCCDRCEGPLGLYGGCYNRAADKWLCWDCFDREFPSCLTNPDEEG